MHPTLRSLHRTLANLKVPSESYQKKNYLGYPGGIVFFKLKKSTVFSLSCRFLEGGWVEFSFPAFIPCLTFQTLRNFLTLVPFKSPQFRCIQVPVISEDDVKVFQFWYYWPVTFCLSCILLGSERESTMGRVLPCTHQPRLALLGLVCPLSQTPAPHSDVLSLPGNDP